MSNTESINTRFPLADASHKLALHETLDQLATFERSNPKRCTLRDAEYLGLAQAYAESLSEANATNAMQFDSVVH